MRNRVNVSWLAGMERTYVYIQYQPKFAFLYIWAMSRKQQRYGVLATVDEATCAFVLN